MSLTLADSAALPRKVNTQQRKHRCHYRLAPRISFATMRKLSP